MTPDEEQKALRHRIANAIRCVCNLHAMRATLCHEERLVVAEAVLAAIDVHRASVEADQPRGLRPLAPEGITAQAMVADAMEGELRRQIADLQSTIKHERQQHAEVAEKHAAEYHRIATALGCHVHDDLAAKAAQSRGAAVPPADSAIAEGPAG